MSRAPINPDDLRMTLHNLEPIPAGVTVRGSMNYDGAYTGRFLRWNQPHTEREWIAQYEQEWPAEPAPTEPKVCECHANMGNDFYFLPRDRCLRRDNKCTGQR